MVLPRFLDRAQKRVAQQRLDSKMALGRIVDIRKRVFNEVKVSRRAYYVCPHSFSTRPEIR